MACSKDVADCAYGSYYKRSKARYPHYQDYKLRLKSFDADWPPGKDQSPQCLAEAGFFHAAAADSTRCYSCGGGLKNWLAGDQPFVEHARWFPQCDFVREKKGADFVSNIRETHPRNNNDSANEPADVPIAKDYNEIVQRVLMTSAGRSVTEMFSKQIAEAAITRSLSDVDWDEKKLRTQELANIAVDIQEKLDKEKDEKEKDDIKPSASVSEEIPMPISASSEATDRESLLAENKRLKDQMMCRICTTKEVSAMFLPCGHLVSCLECAPAQSQCPLCQYPVATTVKVYV